MARPQGGGPPSYSLIVTAIGAPQRTAVNGGKIKLAVMLTNDRDGRPAEGVAVLFQSVPDGALACGASGDPYQSVTSGADGVANFEPTVTGTGPITVRATINGRPADLFVITAAASAAVSAPATSGSPPATTAASRSHGSMWATNPAIQAANPAIRR